TLTVTKSSTTLTANNVTIAYNQSGNLTAILKDSSGNVVNGPSVQFKVGATVVGSAPMTAGVATLPYTPTLVPGTYTITVDFAGDANYGAAPSATATLTVTKANTTLTASNVSIAYNTAGNLTAILKDASGAVINGPSIQFKVGATVVGSAPMTAGVATLPYTPTLAPGTYTITVDFAGDANYGAAPSATATLTVTKANTTLTANNVSIAYSASGNLTAILKDASGAVINGASIQFKVGATVVGSATMTAGVATLPYTPTLAPGTYTITADFVGDANYNAAPSATATLTVTKANTTLTANNVTIAYNTAGNLTAILKDASGAVINGASIQFKVGATVVGSATMTAGVATQPYTATLPPGTYTITVDFAGDANYNAAPSATATLTVPKANSTLTANDVTIAYNTAGNLTAILKDASGAVINGASIQFKVGATVVGSATMTAGVATLSYTPILAPGTYTITADFAADSNYNSSTATANLTVTKANSTLTANNVTIAYNTAGNLTAVLKDAAGAVINGASIQFKVGATVVGSATMTAGVATLPYTPTLAPGTYTITADFAGNVNYNAAPSATATLTVTKANTTLTASNVSIAYNTAGNLTAVLKDASGAVINGASIQFKVGATVVGSATMTAGVATLPYTPTLAPGTYTITVDFAGDANYNAAPSATATLTVTKSTTTLTANNVTIAYNQSGNLTAILKDSSGNVVNGPSIQFKVGATVVGSAPMTAGVATLPYTPTLAPGTYTITVDFAGDVNYSAAPSATATLTVTKANTTLTANDVTIAYNQAGNLTAILKDPAGAVINGASIQFKVGATVVGSATMTAGVATLPYTPTLAPGTYTITADFAGNANYNAAPSATATLTVTKANTTLTANNVSIAYNQSGNLTAVLKDASGAVINGASIQFKVGATVVGSATMTAGVATLPYTANLAPGTYTITVDYAGNANYNAAPSATATLTVTKANTTLTANNVSIAYNTAGNLTAILKDASGAVINGASIQFKVGATVVGSATMSAGVATLPYTPTLAPGTYTITVDYAGDANYNAAPSATATLTVTKAATTLTLTPASQSIIYGQNGTLTATLKDAGGTPMSGQTITFSDGFTTICTGTTDPSGQVTCTPNEPAGPYTITATFATTTNYLASSASATLNVAKAGTTLTLTPSSVSVGQGTNPNFTAVLTENVNNQPVAGVTVTFSVAGQAGTFSGTTDATGTVTVTYGTLLNKGTYTINANYGGNGYYSASSATGTLTVTATTTTLTTSDYTVQYGQSVNLQATLTKDSDGSKLNGQSVSFYVNGTLVGSSNTVSGTGTSTVSWTANLPPGTYTMQAVYSGSGNYVGTTADATITVLPTPSTISALTATSPRQYSDAVTLQATVSPSASGRPVDFYIGGILVGTVNTNGSGVASLTAKVPTPAGTQTVTATVQAGTVAPYYDTASRSTNLTVTKETVTLAYTGDNNAQGLTYDFKLEATLTDGDGSVIDYGAGNVTVQWTITGAGFTTQTHTATVDAAGKATKLIQLASRSYSISTAILVNGYIVEQTLAASQPVVAADTGTGLWGSYYEDDDSLNSTFTTNVLSRLDSAVDFNWGASNPDPALFPNSDSFSVRWTGEVVPLFSEAYEFCVNANDGVRVWSGALQVINTWATRASALESCYTSPTLTVGTHYPVTIEYFDQTGNAEIHLTWRTTGSTNQPKVVIPKSQLYPTITWTSGQGLTGSYYNSTALGNNGDGVAELIRNDADINFTWNAAGIPSVQDDLFYVKWKGTYTPTANHSNMATYSDNGVRLLMRKTGTIPWTTVINNWTSHTAVWNQSANNPLGTQFQAGTSYDVELEMFDNTGTANIALATANNFGAVIPQARFKVDVAVSMPTGFTGTAISSNQVNLNWTANAATTPKISGYVIFRSTTSGFTADQTTLVGSSTTSSFADLNLTGGTTYYYKIAAIDTAGNISTISAQISVTTP
ncbi:MAG TPA: Ig-like domain repeat protein, partial [Symbiobacteriaceae bacterium]|nr:Ig-like domain repeat protein [Symbiobacteriaceae bacterium]